MNKYILRSEYDCLVKTENEESLLDSNSQIIFDYPVRILVYPLYQSKFSYPFVIDLSSNQDGKNYKFIQYEDNKLFYLHSPYSIKNEIIEEVALNGKKYEISLSQEEISFKNSTIKKSFPVLSEFKTYALQVKEPFILLILNGKEDEMFTYNVKSDTISNIKGKKIELVDNEIFVTKNANDIAAHQIYETYEIKDNIEKINSRFKIEIQTKPLKGNIVPLVFIESIKIEDYDLAFSYLSEQLQQSTTVEHLKKYFGKIINYIMLEQNILAITNTKETRVFTFDVKDDKISEIDIFH